MSDRGERELERRAQAGDASAAERLYWKVVRASTGPQVMDRLIEAVIQLQTSRTPSVFEKIAFLRGQPVQAVEPEALDLLQRRWSEIEGFGDLHRIPRTVRQPGFTTYCAGDDCVYRYQASGEWERVVRLSAPPPGRPLHVVQTLRDRDELEVGSREACYVLANRGVYRSSLSTNKYSRAGTVHWQSIRFERGP